MPADQLSPPLPPTRFGELPLAGPHGPGYTQQEYDEALSQVIPPLMNAGLAMGSAAIGGPEVMTAGKLIEGLLMGMPMSQVPGMQLGMVPTLENLPEFREKFIENLANLKSGTKLTPDKLEPAISEAYIATRYPQRYARMKEIKRGGLPEGVSGAYDRPGLFSRERVTLSDPTSVESGVGTLAHESQHVLQQARTPEIFGNYPRSASLPSGAVNPAYWQHPTEVGARQAAGTAQTGLNKFVSMLPGAQPGNPAARTIYNWIRDPQTGRLVLKPPQQ
jgi:hypothetical protein